MNKRFAALLLAVLLVSGLFAACGGDFSASDYPTEASAPAAAAPDTVSGAGGFPSFDVPMSDGESMDNGSGEAYDGAEDSYAPQESQTADDVTYEDGMKIIYTAYMDIQTEGFEESYDALMRLVRENKGYVQRSDTSGGYTSPGGNYYNPSADLVLRIPAERYDAFFEAAGGVGTVTSKQEYTEDITSAYIDTEARLRALKAQETRLLELLARAEVMTDLIEIESKLAEVRYQIESYQSQMNTYDKLIDYATVNIALREVSSVVAPVNTFGQRILAALKGSGEGVARFFDRLVIILIYALPFLLIALVIFLVVRRIFRGKREQRREKLAALQKQYQQQAAAFGQNPYLPPVSAEDGAGGLPPERPE